MPSTSLYRTSGKKPLPFINKCNNTYIMAEYLGTICGAVKITIFNGKHNFMFYYTL